VSTNGDSNDDEPELPSESEPTRSIAIYADFISEQIAAEVASRASLEQRGLAVITTSGALVTLLFGLVAVLTKADSFTLPAESRNWLKVAMVFFVVAAIAGIVTNLPIPRRGARPDDLASVIQQNWADVPSSAQRAVADSRVEILRNAILLNRVKGTALVVAMTAEVGAVLFVALAVARILNST
jgi:hypothetical protein